MLIHFDFVESTSKVSEQVHCTLVSETNVLCTVRKKYKLKLHKLQYLLIFCYFLSAISF